MRLTAVDGVLLDIEGTTSAIEYIYQTMFPFVRRRLDEFLFAHWSEPAVMAALRQIAGDVGTTLLPDALVHDAFRSGHLLAMGQEIRKLMDVDSKTAGLKSLQGLIWRSGFESGELVAHVYDDVPPALERWSRQSLPVRIYSSGSCDAQRLVFSHPSFGNLARHLDGHYDTAIGPKRDRASYERIAEDWGRPAEKLLFVSDVTAELAAAAAAGMQVLLSIRPGNPAQPDAARWPSITSFAEIAIGQPV